jgi:uncharacterized phage protein (TIGR02220 family)
MADSSVQIWMKILRSRLWRSTSDQRIAAITVFLLAAPGKGQLTASLGAIAQTARVSRQTVRSTLAGLQRTGTIKLEPTKDGYHITVLNHALYNPESNGAEAVSMRLPAGPRPWHSEHTPIIAAVLADLTRKSGRKYGLNKTNGKHIAGRLRDGYIKRDLMLVTWDRWIAWRDDSHWQQYLRPTTLFGPEKFETYLPAARAREAELRSKEHQPRSGEQLEFLNGEPGEIE